MLNTPVLFLVFNRLDTTQQVFAKIREIQPKQLFIGADGARASKEGEAEKVVAVRKYILDNIDWDCEVKTLFREQNLGCGVAPAEAITWFFDNVEQGIILEDDCLPDLSFFTFCEELLEYYKDNEQIMHISGSNFQMGNKRGNFSYFFSVYAPAWGWATWRRAWQKYDFCLLKVSKSILESTFKKIQFNRKEINYWLNVYEDVEGGKRKDIWDLQWAFTIWLHNGIAINPQNNLIQNIGFRQDATHTTQRDSLVANLKTTNLPEIIHPQTIALDIEADKFTFEHHVNPSASWYQYLRHQIIPNLVPKFIKKILKPTIHG
jgi:hypothetical protein